MFFSAVVVIAALLLLTVMTTRISRLYTSQAPVTDLDVTPVAGLADTTGWKTFRHADHIFTFRYPASWNVSLTKTNIRDRDYHLLLTYTAGPRTHRVEFLRGGRGAPASDSVRRDTLDYGGRTAYKNIYMKDKQPFKEVITFRNVSTIAPYIAIEAELPPGNTEQYERLVDQIASSIQPVQ